MPPPNEAITRRDLIDPQLQRAGWDVADANHVGIEIPVDGYDPAAWRALSVQLKQLRETGISYEAELPSGICDYALYRPNGEIIVVVEAKKASYNARLAEAQARFYVQELAKRQSFAPFAFTANGSDTYFLDPDTFAPRLVAGFFSLADLENLLYLRQSRRSDRTARWMRIWFKRGWVWNKGARQWTMSYTSVSSWMQARECAKRSAPDDPTCSRPSSSAAPSTTAIPSGAKPAAPPCPTTCAPASTNNSAIFRKCPIRKARATGHTT